VFLILSRVHRGVCLMKASLTTNAFLATGAYLAGYISNQNAAQVVRDAVTALEDGSMLLIFPEGTRTERPPVNELQPGFALIAKRAGAPIQTVLLETTSPYLTKGWPLWRPPPFPMVFKARVGTAMMPSSQTQETARQLQSYFEGELSAPVNPASTQRPRP
jgi:1-acyl-sn-glycerol-3-phosphate acyltransferase